MRSAWSLLARLLAQWVALLLAGVTLGVVAMGGSLNLILVFFGFMLLARHAAIGLLGPLWARLRFLEEENRRLAEAVLLAEERLPALRRGQLRLAAAENPREQP